MDKRKIQLSVILPIYNEQDCIKESIETIFLKMKKYCQNMEVLAVDDGSSDKTPTILQSLSKKEKRLHMITHKKNLGYGAALRSGVKHALYAWVFFTDADMQFDVKELSGFFPFTNRFDFIIGFREHRADSSKAKIRSWTYNRLVRILFGLPLRDVDCAFKLMKKAAVSKISTSSNSFFISAELMSKAHKKKFTIKEIGVRHLPRRRGKSTVTVRRVAYTILDLIKLRVSYI